MTTSIPDLIEVVRSPKNVTRVLIDGVELPYAIAVTEPVTVSIDRKQPPTVRLTLLAGRVHVRDDLFAGEDLDPDHECETDEEVEAE